MLSEDTGTQGARNYELELGYDYSDSHGTAGSLLQPQFSYGLTPRLDLIVQPSWLDVTNLDSRTRGFGDTNFDFKWRFYGAAPLSLGLRAGLETPTAQHDLGIGRGRYAGHGVLVATVDVAPFTLNYNVGYTRAPGDISHRANLYHFSAALQYAQSEKLCLLAEGSFDTNTDSSMPHRYAGIALLGAIFTIRPGMDIDLGYRSGVNAGATTKQVLLGLTLRGAL